MTKQIYIGYTDTDIREYDDEIVCDIPAHVAVEWARECCPDVNTGMFSEVTFERMKSPDHWGHKMFVVVGMEYNKWICLNNKDGKFTVRTLNIGA